MAGGCRGCPILAVCARVGILSSVLSSLLLTLFVSSRPRSLGGHDFSRAEKVQESSGLQPLKKESSHPKPAEAQSARVPHPCGLCTSAPSRRPCGMNGADFDFVCSQGRRAVLSLGGHDFSSEFQRLQEVFVMEVHKLPAQKIGSQGERCYGIGVSSCDFMLKG